MTLRHAIALSVLVLTLVPGGRAHAHTSGPTIELLVPSGTPLRVALDDRVRMKEPGQPLVGTLVEPVYSYDRIVLPKGTKVRGRVARFEKLKGRAKTGAVLSGDFTPLRRAILEFDSLVLHDGGEIAVTTEVRSATAQVVLSTKEPRGQNIAEQAAGQAAAKAKESMAAVKKPRKLDRLKHGLVMSLPFHPQYLEADTVYTAVLLSALSFGLVEATEAAPPGRRPAPESVLQARLLTALDSAKTPRGAAVRAMVTQPVFSEEGLLVLPEGAVLIGEVTLAKPARRFHRTGQLRFLFETVQAPERGPETLRASLRSVQAGRDERMALDDEGGVSSVESKSRFVAPALASLALAGAMNQHLDYDTDGLGPEAQYGTVGTRGVAGLFGWGLAGALLSQVSHTLSVAFGILGVARTVYSSVFGKGRDVVFAEDTTMEVELAAEPAGSP